MNSSETLRSADKGGSILTQANAHAMPRFMQPAAALLKVPLRELFWGLPESTLLEEARQRVEAVLTAALARNPIPRLRADTSFAVA